MPPVPTAESSALDGWLVDDRYRLLEAVGHGASATVYEAQDTRLRRPVALKLLHPALSADPKFRKRFRAEAHAAAQLSHPHLLPVYDWGDGDDVYLVTELLAGGSLRSMLAEGHLLSQSQALLVGLHAAEGLGHLHGRGFVHRDVKPANLLFGTDGRLRLADFGIARAVAEAAWTEPQGALIGTARYAAPEQAAGRGVDGKADVYALALTLIEAVTGSVPLAESTPLATMVRRQDEDLPLMTELGPLAPILAEACRADPKQRPDAEGLAKGLMTVASELDRPQPLALVGLQSVAANSAHSGETREKLGSGVIDLTEHDLDDDLADSDDRPDQNDVGPDVAEPDESPDEYEVGEPVVGRGRLFAVVGLLAMLALVAAAIIFSQEQVEEIPVTPSHLLGSYVGAPVADARIDAAANGWILTETERSQDNSNAGEVLSQQPAAGIELEEGMTVTVVVSLGPELHGVPPLVGLTRADALTAIDAAGLALGTVDSERFDEEVAAGIVIEASAEPGAQLETNQAIDLVVSAGPEPRIVPSLVGLTTPEAELLLSDLGLIMTFSEEYSLEAAEGVIVSTLPGLDESAERGSTVNVVVSLGLPFITVPDVIGLSAAEAATKLAAAGFVVTGTEGSPNKEVLITDPPAGESYRTGHPIRIITRS